MIDLPVELTDRWPRHVYERVRAEGQEFESVDRPPGLYKRRHKACFRNAVNVVQLHPRWLYAEGFALHHDELWFHHAWVVIDSTRAFDPTWNQPALRYIGVTLSAQEACRRVLETQRYGSLL
jgi:hypothetical protein